MPRKAPLLLVLIVLLVLSALGPGLPTAASKTTEPNKHKPTFKHEVVASQGVIATNHPLASAAGQMMLAKGGNAVDAMIAAYFALSVVEPAMSSPFGSGFINLYNEAGEAFTVDNYAAAPLGATPDMYTLVETDERAQAKTPHVVRNEENQTGFRSIGIPGNLKAWLWALRFHGSGQLDLSQIMAPAIDFASNGFPVSAAVSRTIERSRPRVGHLGGWREEFMPGGDIPQAGTWLRRPAYAVTLEALVNASPDNAAAAVKLEAAGARFYTGDIAENIVSYIQANGGVLSKKDMAWYWGDGLSDLSDEQGLRLRDPIRGRYRGYEILAMPPTSSGGTHIVEILNILEGFDLASLGFGTHETLHLMTEAMKIAWADRDAYMGDPDYAGRDPSFQYNPPPVEDLVDEDYAARRRSEIDPTRAKTFSPGSFGKDAPTSLGQPAYESQNTTHATAMDAAGNVISMTQTLNHGFGSGVVLPGRVPGSGMVLNNTMALFDPDPRSGFERANAIAPRKRMLSSMSPTIVLKDGEPYFALGTPGGTRIYAAVLQGIVNVIDHGMSIQQAVEAPRVWTMMFGELNLEEGIDETTELALNELGHATKRVRTVAGGMNGVLHDPQTGLIHGGACWRRDGSAAGWSGGDALDPEEPFPPAWRQKH